MEKVSYVSKSSQWMKAFVLSFLALTLCSFGGFAQKLTVTGTVSDTDGEPLPGVSIVVKGKSGFGVISDNDGKYSISVDSKGSLVYSYVGMTSETVAVNGRTKINVTLKYAENLFDEVVVVGYGKQKKSSITSAVSAIKGDELLKAPTTNVTQMLAGKLPGISSLQTTGQPGQDGASLRVRGSVYGVTYVVDGYPVSSIDDIDPQDIESISVLKDGAAAAVYGLQAAGGVIVIQTKRGDEGPAKITYNGQFGASFNANFPKFMNGPQFAYYYNMAQMMDQLASGVITNRNEYDPYFTKQNVEDMIAGRNGFDNVNYIDKVFGTGFTQKHNVTVQGGTEKTRYFVSVGYMDQEGNVDRFNYKRYNLRSNLDTDFAKNWNFKIGIAGKVGRNEQPGIDAGDSNFSQAYTSVARQAIQIHPYLPVRDAETGLYTGSRQANNTAFVASPLAAIYESGTRTQRSFDTDINFELSYNVPWVDGLRLKVGGSYNYYSTRSKNIFTPYDVMRYDQGVWTKLANSVQDVATGINLSEGSSTGESLIGQAGFTYDKTFGKHNIGILFLGEVRDYKGDVFAAYSEQLPFLSLPYLSFGKPLSAGNPISGSYAHSRSAGYVMRFNYNYDDRYLLEFSGRYDGSYLFSGMAGKQWGFFPSGSIGWRLSNEDFLKDVNWLSDLKVRASVALLGSDNISAYEFLSSYNQGTGNQQVFYPTGNGLMGQYWLSPGGVPNVDLTWEKTLSYNFGFDGTLWNGLLGAEVDAYYVYNYDILMGLSGGHPDSMGGYYPSIGNIGKRDTKGIDISLTHHNTVRVGGKPFTYHVGGTLTYAKTRWLKYPQDPNVMDWQKVNGTAVGDQYIWIADGLYRSEEEIDNSAWMGSRPCLGDIKYVDLNGDGKIDWDDAGYFGKTNRPLLTYGLNIGANWNGFDFNAQFTGGAMFDVSITGQYDNGYHDNSVWTQTFKENANSPLYLVENAYSIDNPNGTFPRITLGETGHGGENGYGSTFWLRSGNYLRLKSAQLGYTLPDKVLRILGIKGLRLYVEGSNLFTIDSLPAGIDPESPGVNNGYYPQQLTVMGGITLTF